MHEIFFTSDSHWNHGNIIKYCNRPFLSPAEQIMLDNNEKFWVSQESIDFMNQTMIDNINQIVGQNDVLWHLGDFLFKGQDTVKHFRDQINCRNINLIFGNHDNKNKIIQSRCFSSLHELHEIKISGKIIVLCHYAMKTWNHSHHGSWHFFGHSHGTLPDDPTSLSIDVGVDCHNFFPLSFDQIVEIMAKKEWKPIDHHGKD